MGNKVVILGAGGFAREVLDIIRACNKVDFQYDFLGFIDENPTTHGKVLNDFPVLGGLDWLARYGDVRAICGIGNPAIKKKVVAKASALGIGFCSLIHPSAILTPFVSIGKGVVITAGTIMTNQITIGDHVIINLDVTVGHDCAIGNFSTVAPGVHISGNVQIGEGCDIGTGAAIIQGITIGEWTIVGAGAVVTKDLPANVTAVGVPANVIKTRDPGWHETV